MKRTLSLLAALLVLKMLPLGTFAASAEVIKSGKTGSCTWTLDDKDHLTISGKGYMQQYEHSPWGTSITSVTVEDGVTWICEHAFSGCAKLTSVTIPDSVTLIRSYAFCNCTGLTSVTIGNGVKTIGVEAFSHCTGLTSVTIGNSVELIDRGAFSG